MPVLLEFVTFSNSNTNTSTDSVLSNDTCFLVSVLISLALYAEFLFQQTHWNSIGLFRQCFKQYYLLLGIGIALNCFDGVLSNIPLNMSLGGIHTLQVSYSNANTSADSVLSNILLNMSPGGIHTLQVSYSNTNTSADSVLSNIPLLLGRCSRFYTIFSMQNFCFDKPIGIALCCFDSVLSNNACFLVCSIFCTRFLCWISVSTNP